MSKLSDADLDAIAEVLGEAYGVPVETVRERVFHPTEDRGQWAVRSLAVVHTEAFAPGCQDGPRWIDRWVEHGHAVSAAIKRDVYFESVNSAVAALYE